MEQLRVLRKKQFLYQNVLYLIYTLIIAALIASGASGPVVYTVLALILIISPLSIWIFGRMNFLLSLFPVWQEIERYEKEKLQNSWKKFHSTSSIIQVVASCFFGVQVFLRDSSSSLAEGIPLIYFVIVALVFFLLANLNDWSIIKQIDQKTTEQLQGITEDRFLFTLIFGIVAVVMTGIGIIVIQVMSSIQPV